MIISLSVFTLLSALNVFISFIFITDIRSRNNPYFTNRDLIPRIYRLKLAEWEVESRLYASQVPEHKSHDMPLPLALMC